MGIVNVTPDSFSGDGLLAPGGPGDPVDAAVDQARRMVGGGRRHPRRRRRVHSARPRARRRGRGDRARRPGRRAIRAALPDMPISIDTAKPAVAAAAIDAGAVLLNDVWGVGRDDAMARLAAERGVPLILMHNRAAPATRTSLPRSSPTSSGRWSGRMRRRRPPGGPHRRPGLRVREDARAQPGAPARARRPRVLGQPDPSRHVPQVHPRPGPGPAAGRAPRGDPGHDRARDRRRSRHRPRSRCSGERPGRPCRRRDRPRVAPGRVVRGV